MKDIVWKLLFFFFLMREGCESKVLLYTYTHTYQE